LAESTNRHVRHRRRRHRHPRDRCSPPLSPAAGPLPFSRCEPHCRRLCPLCEPGRAELLHRVVGRLVYPLLGRAVSGWATAAAQLGRRRGLVRYALRRWMAGTENGHARGPYAALARWAYQAAQQRLMRTRLSHALRGWLNRSLQSAFNRWVDWLGSADVAKQGVLAMMKGDHRRYYWGRWRAAVAWRKENTLCKPEVRTFFDQIGGRCYSREGTPVPALWVTGGGGGGGSGSSSGSGGQRRFTSSGSIRPSPVRRPISANMLHMQEAVQAQEWASGPRLPSRSSGIPSLVS
jgi:hypothetical protein